MKKTFELGDILSVSTGILLSSQGMDGVYNILNHMTQDNLFTHQLLVANPIMREELIRQHAWLRNIEKPEGLKGAEDVKYYMAGMIAIYGDQHEVESAEHLWVGHDVMQDLVGILDGKYKP